MPQEARGEQRTDKRELHALRRAARQAVEHPPPSAASVYGWGLGVIDYGGACGASVSASASASASATPCGALPFPSTASTPETRQARAASTSASSEEEWSLSENEASTE